MPGGVGGEGREAFPYPDRGFQPTEIGILITSRQRRLNQLSLTRRGNELHRTVG